MHRWESGSPSRPTGVGPPEGPREGEDFWEEEELHQQGDRRSPFRGSEPLLPELPLLQPGDIVAFRKSLLWGGLVRLVERVPVNHLALVLKKLPSKDFGLMEPLGRGVVLRKLSDHYGETIYVWRVPDRTFSSASLLDYACDTLAAPRDWAVVVRRGVRNLLPRPRGRAREAPLRCTTFVSEYFSRQGLRITVDYTPTPTLRGFFRGVEFGLLQAVVGPLVLGVYDWMPAH